MSACSKKAMLAAQRLEATAMSGHKREAELRQQFLDEQRKKLDAMPNNGGVTEETKQAIREALGIV